MKNSTQLLGLVEADYRTLKDTGREGEVAMHQNGFLDGFFKGYEEGRKDSDVDYTEELHRLNEEWKENLAIQRQMLTDKASGWIKEQLKPMGAKRLDIWEEEFRASMTNSPKDEEITYVCVGEVVEYKGKKYKCVRDDNADDGCSRCAFGELCSFPLGSCDADYRVDKNYVHFIEVED